MGLDERRPKRGGACTRRGGGSRTLSGFTIMEVLIVVALISVVGAFAAPTFVSTQRSLENMQRNSRAQSIYNTVQNRLTALQSTGHLQDLTSTLASGGGGHLVTEAPSDYGDLDTITDASSSTGTGWDWSEKVGGDDHYYYRVYQVYGTSAYGDSTTNDSDQAITEYLMTSKAGVISRELYGGEWLIEVSPSTGEVYGVFYWDTTNDDGELQSALASRSSDGGSTLWDKLDGWRESGELGDHKVGYYRGGPVDRAVYYTNNTYDNLQWRVVNSEELYVAVTSYDESAHKDDKDFVEDLEAEKISVEVTVSGDNASGGTSTWTKTYDGEDLAYRGTTTSGTPTEIDIVLDSMRDDATDSSMKDSFYNITTCQLDSTSTLTGTDAEGKSLGSYSSSTLDDDLRAQCAIVPGSNITVSVKVLKNGSQAYRSDAAGAVKTGWIAPTNKTLGSVQTNSAVGYYEADTSNATSGSTATTDATNGGTVTVWATRHLYNLQDMTASVGGSALGISEATPSTTGAEGAIKEGNTHYVYLEDGWATTDSTEKAGTAFKTIKLASYDTDLGSTSSSVAFESLQIDDDDVTAQGLGLDAINTGDIDFNFSNYKSASVVSIASREEGSTTTITSDGTTTAVTSTASNPITSFPPVMLPSESFSSDSLITGAYTTDNSMSSGTSATETSSATESGSASGSTGATSTGRHKISNFVIETRTSNGTKQTNTGLFSVIGSKVENLDLVNFKVTSERASTGALAGNAVTGGSASYTVALTDVHSYVTSSTGSSSSQTGTSTGGTIDFANYQVEGKAAVGGLIGGSTSSTLTATAPLSFTDCSVVSNVTGTGNNVGGFVGVTPNTVSISGSAYGTDDAFDINSNTTKATTGTATDSDTDSASTTSTAGDKGVPELSGAMYVGGFVGRLGTTDAGAATPSSSTASAKESTVTASSIKSTSKSNAGGVFGYAGYFGTSSGILSFEDDTVTVTTVSAKNNRAGGFVGTTRGASTFNACTATVSTCSTEQYSSATDDQKGYYVGGLVGYAEGDTATVSVAGSTVNGGTFTALAGDVGGLVGRAGAGAAVADSHVAMSDSIVATNEMGAGGLIGKADAATSLQASYVTATNSISAKKSRSGGLIGGAAVSTSDAEEEAEKDSDTPVNVTIGTEDDSDRGCYAQIGTVSAGTQDAGGLIGVATGTTEIHDSYATADSVYATTNYAGGLVGRSKGNGSSMTISDSAAGRTLDGTVYRSSSDAYMNVTARRAWAGGLVGLSTYTGDISDCYAVADVAVTMDASGDFQGTRAGGLIGAATSVRDGAQISGCYVGEWGADGSARANVSVSATSYYVGGLIGTIFGSCDDTDNDPVLVDNHVLADVSSGMRGAGGLVGSCGNVKNPDAGTDIVFSARDCTVGSERLLSNVTADQQAGGLVGFYRGGTFENCGAFINVTASSSHAGGAFGSISTSGHNATVTNSFARGDVATPSDTGGDDGTPGYVRTAGSTAGGFVGTVDGDGATITSSYAAMAVQPTDGASSSRMGGFVGSLESDATISYCYAGSAGLDTDYKEATDETEEVAADLDVMGDANVGGFVGYANNGTIDSCYTTSNVYGSSSTGGFVASTGGFVGEGAQTATVTNSRVYGRVSGDDTSAGAFLGLGALDTSDDAPNAYLKMGGYNDSLSATAATGETYSSLAVTEDEDAGVVRAAGYPYTASLYAGYETNFPFELPSSYGTDGDTYYWNGEYDDAAAGHFGDWLAEPRSYELPGLQWRVVNSEELYVAVVVPSDGVGDDDEFASLFESGELALNLVLQGTNVDGGTSTWTYEFTREDIADTSLVGITSFEAGGVTYTEVDLLLDSMRSGLNFDAIVNSGAYRTLDGAAIVPGSDVTLTLSVSVNDEDAKRGDNAPTSLDTGWHAATAEGEATLDSLSYQAITNTAVGELDRSGDTPTVNIWATRHLYNMQDMTDYPGNAAISYGEGAVHYTYTYGLNDFQNIQLTAYDDQRDYGSGAARMDYDDDADKTLLIDDGDAVAAAMGITAINTGDIDFDFDAYANASVVSAQSRSGSSATNPIASFPPALLPLLDGESNEPSGIIPSNDTFISGYYQTEDGDRGAEGTARSHSISNFVINETSYANSDFNRTASESGDVYTGLFAETRNSIDHIDVYSFDVDGAGGSVGTLVGDANYGDLDHVRVYDSYVDGTDKIGGIVGDHNAGNATNNLVQDTHVTARGYTPEGDEDAYAYAGGIAGAWDDGDQSNNTVIDSTVTGTGWYTGGHVGYHAAGTIENALTTSTNDLESTLMVVTGTKHTGGIVGYNDDGAISSSKVANSIVRSEKGDEVGGISGTHNSGNISDCTVEDCTVSGDDHVGGMTGDHYWGDVTSSTVTNTTVTGTGNYVGGITGRNREDVTYGGETDDGNTVSGCVISATSDADNKGNHVGGVTGYWTGGTMSNCTVSASDKQESSVTGSRDYVGGLVGELRSGTLSGCVVIGRQDVEPAETGATKVTGKSYVGGLVGEKSGSGEAKITGCSYTVGTEVSGDSLAVIVGVNGDGAYVGGAIGQLTKGKLEVEETHVISSVRNSAVLVEDSNAYRTGGFAGSVEGTAAFKENCYVQGYMAGEISGQNNGVPGIVYTGGGVAGGFVGYVNNVNATFEKCHASMQVRPVEGLAVANMASQGMGGFVGEVANGSTTAGGPSFTYCYSGSAGFANNAADVVADAVFEGWSTATDGNGAYLADVSGPINVGGFAGASEGGTYEYCYTTSNVTGDIRTAGFVGSIEGSEDESSISVSNSLALGKVTGTSGAVNTSDTTYARGSKTYAYASGKAGKNNLSNGAFVGYYTTDASAGRNNFDFSFTNCNYLKMNEYNETYTESSATKVYGKSYDELATYSATGHPYTATCGVTFPYSDMDGNDNEFYGNWCGRYVVVMSDVQWRVVNAEELYIAITSTDEEFTKAVLDGSLTVNISVTGENTGEGRDAGTSTWGGAIGSFNMDLINTKTLENGATEIDVILDSMRWSNEANATLNFYNITYGLIYQGGITSTTGSRTTQAYPIVPGADVDVSIWLTKDGKDVVRGGSNLMSGWHAPVSSDIATVNNAVGSQDDGSGTVYAWSTRHLYNLSDIAEEGGDSARTDITTEWVWDSPWSGHYGNMYPHYLWNSNTDFTNIRVSSASDAANNSEYLVDSNDAMAKAMGIDKICTGDIDFDFENYGSGAVVAAQSRKNDGTASDPLSTFPPINLPSESFRDGSISGAYTDAAGNGLNHSISNFVIKGTSTDTGLFSVLGMNASDLDLVNFQVTSSGSESTGVLAGTTYIQDPDSYAGFADLNDESGGTIRDVNVIGGSVTVTKPYTYGWSTTISNTGGLIGYMVGGTIEDCSVRGTMAEDGSAGTPITVSGSQNIGETRNFSYSVGGLAGTAKGVNVTDSFAAAQVSGYKNVGGLIGEAGYFQRRSTIGTSISNSYSGSAGEDVDVYASSNNAGGLVGALDTSSTSNSYSTSNVSGRSRSNVGGLVGEASSATVTSSTVLGKVTNGNPFLGSGTLEEGSDGNAYLQGTNDYNKGTDSAADAKAYEDLATGSGTGYPYTADLVGTAYPFATVTSDGAHYGDWPTAEDVGGALTANVTFNSVNPQNVNSTLTQMVTVDANETVEAPEGTEEDITVTDTSSEAFGKKLTFKAWANEAGDLVNLEDETVTEDTTYTAVYDESVPVTWTYRDPGTTLDEDAAADAAAASDGAGDAADDATDGTTTDAATEVSVDGTTVTTVDAETGTTTQKDTATGTTTTTVADGWVQTTVYVTPGETLTVPQMATDLTYDDETYTFLTWRDANDDAVDPTTVTVEADGTYDYTAEYSYDVDLTWSYTNVDGKAATLTEALTITDGPGAAVVVSGTPDDVDLFYDDGETLKSTDYLVGWSYVDENGDTQAVALERNDESEVISGDFEHELTLTADTDFQAVYSRTGDDEHFLSPYLVVGNKDIEKLIVESEAPETADAAAAQDATAQDATQGTAETSVGTQATEPSASAQTEPVEETQTFTDLIEGGKYKVGGALWAIDLGTSVTFNAWDNIEIEPGATGQVSNTYLYLATVTGKEKAGDQAIAVKYDLLGDTFSYGLVTLVKDENSTSDDDTKDLVIDEGSFDPFTWVYGFDEHNPDKTILFEDTEDDE